jgi:MoaA/NifB/PqqE/SkfB family radical SAM enzyme
MQGSSPGKEKLSGNAKSTCLLTFILRKLRDVAPHAGWIARYALFHMFRGRLRGLFNFLYAAFVTKEEGVIALFEPLYRKNWRLVPLPRRIELEPTTRCSLRCLKCEHRYWKEHPHQLTFEECRRIIDQFPGLRAISLSGIGHNFENPEYMEMLRYSKKKGIYTQFFDTFLFLNEERARECIRIAVDRIMISMDAATAETYDRLHEGARFDHVTRNIRRMVNLKKEARSLLPELCFVFVAMRDNVRELSAYLDLIHGMLQGTQPVIWVQIIRLITFDENRELQASEEEYGEEIRKMLETARRLGRFRFSFLTPPPVKHSPRLCTAWTVPFITAEGDVFPCCTFNEGNVRHLMRERNLGNVLRTDFREIWESKEYTALRSTFSKGEMPDLCRKYSNCPYFEGADEGAAGQSATKTRGGT